jgi:hypothetical protein
LRAESGSSGKINGLMEINSLRKLHNFGLIHHDEMAT